MSNKKCEWEWKKLGEVCDFQGGTQPPKEEWKKEAQHGYIRMLQIRDFTQSRNFEIEYVKVTNKLKICTDKDIMLGRYGASVGKVLSGLAGAYNVALIKASPNENLVRDFVKYYFKCDLFQSLLLKVCSQRTAQAGFSREDIFDFPIPIPPLAEQERIVKVLDDAFAKIDKIKTDAETNLQNAKDLFQTTLANELSITDEKIKQGWEEVSLEDCCEIKSALVDPKEKQYQQLLHIGGANIESEKGSLIDLKTAEEEKLISGKFLFDESMILYSKIRPYLKKIVRPTFSGLCSADIYPLSTLKNMDKNYLYYVLYSEPFTDYANKNSARAGMPKLNRESLFAYSFLLPPLSIQKQIVAKLDSLSEKVKQLESNYKQVIADCDELKKSILKKAFNGEL